ncbi:MAG: gliding motility-associated C-terminal domain-containing protein [Flavobacteriales bacterium]
MGKYNSSGGGLVYSTYLGGTSIESPHSIVVTKDRELVIFGSTSSMDFPTSANAFDKTFNGGTSVTTDNVLSYSIGADIFVTKLNAKGSAIVGSTIVGGNMNDGLNDEYIVSKLFYNYGDIFRGEVIVDANGNPIIATTTSSTNFPIVGGFQKMFGGGSHDAVVMKFNDNLSALTWSTYIGGAGDDAAYSVQFDSKGDLYVTGGTQSNNFPTTNNVIHKTALGGIDGFLAHISSNASTILASTYIGTAQYDQCYFVQLDKNDNVFVYGQSLGAYPVFPAGVYNNANSHQFIHKLNSALTTTIFSTVFGSGSANTDLVPSAFLVNNCEDIYISAWGGKINSIYSPNNPPGSTNGMPLSADAYQKTTDGSDFYLAVFSPDAGSLKYGTYFGGPTSLEHVDGGTSRFDKQGNVYQAVCGGCGGNSDFPTTPGAWSTTNQSSNCNLAVIKFDVSKLTANINGNVDSVACVNEPIVFNNSSHGGTRYEWDLGDGTLSNDFQPTHAYSDTGYFTIRLVAIDPSGCPPSDTTFMLLHVFPQVNMSVFPNDSICPGKSVTLTASGATSYTWKPAATLNKAIGAQVTATPLKQTTYVVNGNSFCNKDSAEITITLYSLAHQISPEDSVCPGTPHPLSASVGSNFSWTPSNLFTNPNIGNTNVTIFGNSTVHVNFKSFDGCDIQDSVLLKVILPPNVKTASDTLICFNESVTLNPHINGNYTFKWIPNTNLDDDSKKHPIASPKNTTLYKSIVSNMCGVDTAFYNVRVSKVQGSISKDTTICRNDSIMLLAKGGVNYLWSPANTLTSSVIHNPKAFPQGNTQYKVIITNNDGCNDSLYTTVSLATKPFTGIKDEYLVEYGDDQQINATFEEHVFWSPSTYLSCTDCASPLIRIPEDDITYQYVLFDEKGCYFKDSIKVFVIRKVYVPNAISTNGDGLNDVFYFRSISVEEFELMIFNRWGELLFTSNDINKGWDGTFKGQPVQIDTYVWKVRYKRFQKDLWNEEYGIVTVVE